MKYLLLIGLLIFSSCSIEKRITRKCNQLQYLCPPQIELRVDSIITIKEVLRDTTITIFTPVDSVSIMAMVICDEHNKAQLNKQYFKSNKKKLEIEIVDGKLTASYLDIIDSLKYRLFLKDKLVQIKRNKQKIFTITKYKMEPIDYVCRTIVGTLLFVFLIFIIYLIIKHFKK